MDDFLREVQDDIKRQKWQAVWDNHGRKFVTLVTLIVVAAAGWQLSKHMAHTQNTEQTDALLAAVKESSVDTFQTVQGETDGVHQAFATLVEAQMHSNAGDAEKANAALAGLAKKSGDAMPNQLANALTEQSGNTDIFQYTADERAGWKAIENKDFDAARSLFENIIQSDKEVPASLYDRAKAGIAYANAQQKIAKNAATKEQ